MTKDEAQILIHSLASGIALLYDEKTLEDIDIELIAYLLLFDVITLYRQNGNIVENIENLNDEEKPYYLYTHCDIHSNRIVKQMSLNRFFRLDENEYDTECIVDIVKEVKKFRIHVL